MALERLRDNYDTLLVDTGAGISPTGSISPALPKTSWWSTLEPTALADAYAVIKVLRNRRKVRRFQLLVNQVHQVSAAEAVHERLLRVAERFLDVEINLLGHIYADSAVASGDGASTAGPALPDRSSGALLRSDRPAARHVAAADA